MAKKQWRTLALLLAAFALGSLLLVACARPGSPTASSGGSSSSSSSSSSNTGSCPTGDTVKTGVSSFEQTCITLSKGGTLKIVQDQTSFHIFDYGQWNNGTAQTATYPGAPELKDLKLQGPSVSIGPFTTAGTFHIYCTVHQNMDLTVIVK